MSDEEKNINEVEETQEEIKEEPIQEEVVEEAPAEEVQEEPAKEEAAPKKKKKLRWKDMTPEQKKKRRIRDIIISATVIGLVIVLFGIFALAGYLGNNTNREMIKNIEKVETIYKMGDNLNIDEETGYYTFTVENDATFKVLQLTDIHIGGGAFSISKDNWALNAVAKMVQGVKPDLVIVTGDIGYPVPFQAGTFNNKREAETFAELMEQLGIYWAFAFGNHDTEAYSLYSREEIGEEVYLHKELYPHCLYQTGPADVDGYCNYIINVKNKLGIITQSFVMLDSHSYTDGDILGIGWKYDNIHQNQVDWYKAEINKLNALNKTKFATLNDAQKLEFATAKVTDKCKKDSTITEAQKAIMIADELVSDNALYTTGMSIKSSLYFHIPLVEYKDAYDEYVDNNKANSGQHYEYLGGIAGETGKVVYCGMHEDNLFETIQEVKSTTHVFCGHDHLNNFAFKYWGKNGNKETDWGVVLSYGYSIDYLAYAGIAKKYEQRGGTIISIAPSGELSFQKERLIDIA